jgi:hypothetical protein
MVLFDITYCIVLNSTYDMVNCFGVESAVMVVSPRCFCWRLNVSWLLFSTIILCLYYAPVAEVSD